MIDQMEGMRFQCQRYGLGVSAPLVYMTTAKLLAQLVYMTTAKLLAQ